MGTPPGHCVSTDLVHQRSENNPLLNEYLTRRRMAHRSSIQLVTDSQAQEDYPEFFWMILLLLVIVSHQSRSGTRAQSPV